MLFGVNQRPRSLVRDLCETQTAECRVSRKRVIGAGFLLELLARGENRLFSPEEVRPICFCGTKKEAVRKADSFQNKSFACGERRLKSKKKSRLAGNIIRSESRLARRESRPLKNRSGLSELFSLKG